MDESFMPPGILLSSVRSSKMNALAVWNLGYGGRPIAKSSMRVSESANGRDYALR